MMRCYFEDYIYRLKSQKTYYEQYQSRAVLSNFPLSGHTIEFLS